MVTLNDNRDPLMRLFYLKLANVICSILTVSLVISSLNLNFILFIHFIITPLEAISLIESLVE